MKFTIWQVSPTGYTHSLCFSEVALSLRDGLWEVGYGAEIVTSPPFGMESVIILGAHLLHPDDLKEFKNPVIWQLEQIPGKDEEWKINTSVYGSYIEALKRAVVWDYSSRNVGLLARMGVESRLLPVGYSESLTRIQPAAHCIDVLHYGSLNERRSKILQELQRRGVNVHHAFDCYGEERDALIARSRVVLNIHYYESKIFEIVRCSYLMANKKCIVSETGYGGEAYDDGICFATYDCIIDSVIRLLADSGEREALYKKGFELFSQKKQSGFLRGVL